MRRFFDFVLMLKKNTLQQNMNCYLKYYRKFGNRKALGRCVVICFVTGNFFV